jgi:hypothetical protein
LKDHWIVVVIAIALLFMVLKLVKTVFKWVLVAVIVFAVIGYGGYNMKDLSALGNKVQTQAKDQAIKAMAGEASQAEYQDNGDGSYTIKTPNLELSGVPNSGKVNVKFHGLSLGTWNMEGAVRDFVVQARAAAKK